jgi:hypothetical protein
MNVAWIAATIFPNLVKTLLGARGRAFNGKLSERRY